jgi:ABC-type multidrug transport system ATPase subunit
MRLNESVPQISLSELLRKLSELGGSDLHITTGSPPQVRVDGHLRPLESYRVLTSADTKQLAYSVLTDAQKHRFEENLELDFSFGVKGLSRFRANLFNQRGAVGAVFRAIPYEIKAFEELGLPVVVKQLCEKPRGLILVTGPTGSGKSTLADLIARTYDPDRGRILLDGVDIRELRPEDLRNAVGFVPQETFLFSDTIRENILFGSDDDGRLQRAVETAQLTETLAELPAGADTMLGERGINLSGGQKQRTAIARALAKSPPVFVLDDALSAVDAQTETRILRSLRGALEGRTNIIISHRLAAVRDADWILVLDGGEIVEQGTHQQLVASNGRYWQLLSRQQLEEEIETGEHPVSASPVA